MSNAGPGRGVGFVLGVCFTLGGLAVGGVLYLKYGHLPVAVADKPFPLEKQIVRMPLGGRIDRELQQPPLAASEPVFAAGAQVYAESCAACHGLPGMDTTYAKYMYPRAPQLWKKHARGNVVGVSDDPAGETYWKVKNGIRLTGMPAFEHLLTDEQMWDVTLLVANADKPMSDAVKSALSRSTTAAQAAEPAPAVVPSEPR